jgi:hypothetical protein
MADIDDQNTPKDDFAQSIDGDSDESSPDTDLLSQASEINDESQDADPTFAGSEEHAAKEKAAAGKPEGPKTAKKQAPEPEWDESTLVGRLEKKLSSVTDVLWEKEGLQMQFTIGKNIREEYYRRWKGEGNTFLILAARIHRRLEKERAKARSAGKSA